MRAFVFTFVSTFACYCPPTNAGGKAIEPTLAEWGAAAKYEIVLGATPTNGDFRLLIDYVGDCARVYHNGRLLTDNWYSAYTAEGGMEVGLNYLAGENPGLLLEATKLELWYSFSKKLTGIWGEFSIVFQIWNFPEVMRMSKTQTLVVGGCFHRILPLRQTSLENIVYLQNGSNPSGTAELWPDFQGQASILQLRGVSVKGLQFAELAIQ